MFAASANGAAWGADDTADIPESQRILECVADNMPPALRITEVVMHTHSESDSAEGAELIVFKAYIRERHGKRSISAVVDAPDALSGTAYLMRQTDEAPEVYYYSPELGNARRIEGNGAGSGVFGSALSFVDFENIQRAMRTSSITLRKRRESDAAQRRRMTVLPPPGSSAPFGRIDLLVDTERCFIVQAIVENTDGERIRQLRIPDGALEKVRGGVWYPRRLVVENPENGRVSEVEVRELDLPDAIPEARFAPDTFFRRGN